MQHLANIINIANDLEGAIAPFISARKANDSIIKVPSLNLPTIDHGLLVALGKRNLAVPMQQSILQIFEQAVISIKESNLSHWQRLHASVPSLQKAELFPLLSSSFTKAYVRALEELKTKVLLTIDTALQQFHRDSEASAQSENESSDEGQMHNRGHSRLAVTILEKAYARTTNITRAEKIRLAAATKLKPRQVTIWFQNRRNRKTANNCYKYKRETTPPLTTGGRKRKAEGLYDEGARHPSQRMRSSTPENSPEMSRDVYLSSTSSSSSSVSSVDSLASFFGSRNFNSGYTFSTDSSLADDDCALKKQYNPPKTPICISFDDQLRSQGLTSSPRCELADLDASNAMIFSDEGILQLDFDDLDLDLESIASDLPSFNLKDFDFVIPAPTSISSPAQRQSNKTTSQGSFAVPNVPTSPYDAAAMLNSSYFIAREEIERKQEKEGWALGESPIIEQSCSEDDLSWFLNLQGLSPGSAASPNGQSSAIESHSSSSSVHDAPLASQDFFNFSVEGLFLDNIFEQNLDSFQISDGPTPGKSPFGCSIDIEAANAYPMDDVMKTAVPRRTIFE